jgi:hypothetical protein
MEYYLPGHFYERLAVETEEQKRVTRQEVLAWILEHGTPIECVRHEHLVQ